MQTRKVTNHRMLRQLYNENGHGHRKRGTALSQTDETSTEAPWPSSDDRHAIKNCLGLQLIPNAPKPSSCLASSPRTGFRTPVARPWGQDAGRVRLGSHLRPHMPSSPTRSDEPARLMRTASTQHHDSPRLLQLTSVSRGYELSAVVARNT